jgi:hypothetical protein
MEEIAVGKLNDIADGDYKIFAVEELEVGIFRNGSKVLASIRSKRSSHPTRRAPGFVSASSATSSARGTVTSSISPPAAILATRRCA